MNNVSQNVLDMIAILIDFPNNNKNHLKENTPYLTKCVPPIYTWIIVEQDVVDKLGIKWIFFHLAQYRAHPGIYVWYLAILWLREKQQIKGFDLD